MKVLVTVKRVPDPDLKIKVNPAGTGIIEEGLNFIVNQFDEIAVEEAVRLKEAGAADEVVAVTIGPDDAQTQLRTALAMGADRGIHVKTAEKLDSDAVARILAKIYEAEKPSLILMGKQATDDDANQAGQILAELLGLPQATFASKLTVSGGKAVVMREIDGGMDEVEIVLPGVVTADLRLNEPRYPSLPNIMKAKKKPVDAKTPADFGVDITPKVVAVRFSEPPARKAGQKVPDVATLVDKLINEAKVL